MGAGPAKPAPIVSLPGRTLSLQEQLDVAAQRGYAQAITSLLAAGANPNVSTDLSDRRTPLHLACERARFREDTAYLEALLAAKGIDVNAADAGGLTALHLAVMSGVTKEACDRAPVHAAVRLLLNASARVNASASDGLVALHLAAQAGDAELVRTLLAAGADANAKTNAGRNAAGFALDNGHLDLVSELFAAGARADCVVGRAPVHIVESMVQSAAKFEALLKADGVDLTYRNQEGQTLLWRTTDGGTLKRLVSLGLSVNAQDHTGATPLHWVLSHLSDSDLAKLLLRLGADPNIQDCAGRTPLHIAAAEPPSLLFSASLVEMLLAAGADPTVRDREGRTPVDLAQAVYDEPVVALLTKRPSVKLR